MTDVLVCSVVSKHPEHGKRSNEVL